MLELTNMMPINTLILTIAFIPEINYFVVQLFNFLPNNVGKGNICMRVGVEANKR